LALLVLTGRGFGPPPHGYYGTDDRQDVYELSGENLEDADSVVALFPSSQVNDLGDGTAALLTVNYGDSYNLCPSERFREQPSGSFCSGVLVAPDIIATAAHCIKGENIADIRFVFGYQMRIKIPQNLSSAIPIFTQAEKSLPGNWMRTPVRTGRSSAWIVLW
jgi:hypothetical protein